MSDQFDLKKKKAKKDKNGYVSESAGNETPDSSLQQMNQTADKRKIQELEERIKTLESRFRLLEDFVPKELRNISGRVVTLGQWVGYDKGEKQSAQD
jgi:hypothetical protein